MSEPIDPREQFGEHGEWDALAVGWALSALDPEDEERFAGHLPGCAQCTATVRESLYTVADLAYALPDEAPPQALKGRLMAAVAAEPRTPGGAAPEPEVPAEAEPEEEWPLGEPHPGSPGYGIDWFAKPPRSTDTPSDDAPPVGDAGAPQPGWQVDEPTLETRRLDLSGADDEAEQPDLDGEAAGDQPTAPERAPSDDRGDLRSGPDEVEDPPAAADRAPTEPAAEAGTSPTDRDEADGERDVADLTVADRGAADVGVTDRGVAQPAADQVAAERGEAADVVPLAPRRRRLARRVGVGVAAAAVLALIAGLLAWNVALRNQQGDLEQVVAQREAAIEQLTANGPARVAALTADGRPSPERRATLVVRGDKIEIIIETLGATTGNQTYWLWTLRCDTPQPTDLKPIRGFTVTQSEFSVRDIGSDPGVASAPCFAISSELGTATPKTPRQVVAVGQPE